MCGREGEQTTHLKGGSVGGSSVLRAGYLKVVRLFGAWLYAAGVIHTVKIVPTPTDPDPTPKCPQCSKCSKARQPKHGSKGT